MVKPKFESIETKYESIERLANVFVFFNDLQFVPITVPVIFPHLLWVK